MKRVVLTLVLCGVFLLTGCKSYNERDIVKELENKLNKANSYFVQGEMEITNNEDIYTYSVEVSFKEKDNYKVVLTNTSNDHTQVILRNSDGVYVVTPSLNKSFKFQSDWPYNNSQVYLLKSLIEDMGNEDGRSFEKSDKGYIFTTKVVYPNNEKLVKQTISLDKKLNIDEVRVLDKDNNTQIKMKYNKIDWNKGFSDDYFDLSSIIDVTEAREKSTVDNGNGNVNSNSNSNNNSSSNSNDNSNMNSNSGNNDSSVKGSDNDRGNLNGDNSGNNGSSANNGASDNSNMNSNSNTNANTNTNTNTNTNNSSEESSKTETKETASLDDVIYPMYLPSNTYLKGTEKFKTDTGQRLILTFEGDNPFTLVEETVTRSKDHEIIPTYGELELLLDAVAIVNDNSVNWISNGTQYYITSDTLATSSLLEVARSISVLPVSK